MSQSDSAFFKSFLVILGILVLFTFSVVAIAKMIAPQTEMSDLARKKLNERIAPVGTVITDADQLVVSAVTTSVSSEPKSGQEVIDAACLACHQAGVAGAPSMADAAEWERRLGESGIDGLIASVINGKGAMPPRGGSQFSDDELAAAVKVMVGQ